MRLADFLRSELGIALAGDGTFAELASWPYNAAAFRTAGAERLARALERGATLAGPLGSTCIELVVSALELSDECDVQDNEHMLAWIGRHVRTDSAGSWIDALMEKVEQDGDAEALELVERILRLPRVEPRARTVSAAVAARAIALLDGPMRAQAAALLEAIVAGDPGVDVGAAVPKLIAMLGEPSMPETAADALGRIRDRRAIDPLIAALGSAAIPTRIKAYHVAPALEALGALAAAPALIALVDQASGYERERVIAVLAKLTGERHGWSR